MLRLENYLAKFLLIRNFNAISKFIVLLFIVFIETTLSAQTNAKPADKFVDMIGVCCHFSTNWNQYTNIPTDSLREKTATSAAINMRIRHLRDGIYGWKGGTEDLDAKGRGVVERFSAISQAGLDAGIPGGLTWIITDNTDDWKRLRDDYLIPLGNKVIVLEGANENMGTTGNTQAYQQIKNWWNNILPSLPNLKIATNTGPTAACEILNAGYIGDYVHYGNAHPYHFWPPVKPWGKVSHCNFNSTCAPPTISLWKAPDNNGGTVGYLEATRYKRVRADQPMIFTEWGYPTSALVQQGWGVNEDVAAKYVLRGFLEHFNEGIIYSCHYQLIDPKLEVPANTDAENYFGLANFDGSLKQSGLALKRIIELLEDSGKTDISTHPLNYTLSSHSGLSFTDDSSALTNEIHQCLVQKSDSTYYLILWQEAFSTNSKGITIDVPTADVKISFDKNISRLRAFLPATTDNSSPTIDTTNISSITVGVPDHPLVIEIIEKTGNIPVTGINIITDVDTLKVNATTQLSAEIVPGNATINRVSWKSSNTSIATVSYSGQVMGKNEGDVTITATSLDGNFSSSYLLKIISVTVVKISVSPKKDSLNVFSATQLTVVFNPTDASKKNINWYSSNTSVAIVNETGLVTALSEGNATITATTVDGNKTDTCEIYVNKIRPISWVIIDNKSTSWTMSGYADDLCPTCYNGTVHSTNIINGYAQTTFSGTDVEAYCEAWNGAGIVEVFIDGVSKGLFSQSNEPFGGAKIFVTVSGLKDTVHTIKIVSTSTNWTSIDYIRYVVNETPPEGVLSGSVIFETAPVNLSSNTSDWKHFRNNDHKKIGTKINFIHNYAVIGGTASFYSDGLTNFSWSSGLPTFTGTNNTNGVSMQGIGKGFTFTVNADDADTLKIYVSGYNSGGALIAQLSNFAATDYVNIIETTADKWDAVYTLIYNAKQAGKTLTITWIQATGDGDIRLQAASIMDREKVTKIAEFEDYNNIEIFPNPAISGKVTLYAEQTGLLRITDLSGKVIRNLVISNTGNTDIDLSGVQSGIYIVKYISEGSSSIEKLVIQ